MAIIIADTVEELIDPLNENFSDAFARIGVASANVADLAELKGLTTRPTRVDVSIGRARGAWRWVSGDTATADDSLIVQCTSGPGGRYYRIWDGTADVRWFDPAGGESAISDVYLQAAFDAADSVVITADTTVWMQNDVTATGKLLRVEGTITGSASIIGVNYLRLAAPADLAAFKALTARPLIVVFDGSNWTWMDGDATPANGTATAPGTILQCTSGAAGRYYRNFIGAVVPAWWGAPGDGTDQAVALQAWADMYEQGYSLYAPPGEYNTSVEIVVMPYATAPTATTQTPRPTITFDRNAVFKATAAMTSVMTFGSVASDFTGCFFDGLLQGGTFDANFSADFAVYVPFCRQFRIDGVHARNAMVHNIRIGDNASPAPSFEGFVSNCRTGRDLVAVPIAAISQANPGVVRTTGAHPFSTSDVLCLTSIGGMVELNGTYVTATVVDADEVSIGVDTSGYSAYTSGGNAYLTVMGTGIAGVYYENCTDNQVDNLILNGVEDGLTGTTVAGTLGIYNAKISRVHVWNYLENGRLRYGFDVGGDNTLLGCQVDGPFQKGYRWRRLGNKAYGCGINYTGETYGGRDNVDYTDLVETGGGVTHYGPIWIAQSASARLAGTISGDTSNWAYYGARYANIVAAVLDADDIHSVNATATSARRNLNAGASAIIQDIRQTDAGTVTRFIRSAAGGGQAWDDWSGSTDRMWSAGNAGARHRFQDAYADKFVVGADLGLSNLAQVPLGYGFTTGVGGTVTQGSGSGKATGVTLNTVCGRITTDAATLNAGAAVSFTLTNDKLKGGQILWMQNVAGGTPGAYLFDAQCAAGSAVITIRNVSASNLSEAIVIAFGPFVIATG